ncbi:hypothetical protein [Halobacillus litoralis]|uniref:hypothetical protein n=1 Tax=Halobacillus litoralis TaxID=45668 RepID=UPI001CFCE58A|nr:hypothetical protein [Halobacillus litoralis]
MKRHYDIANEELGIYGWEETSLQNILAILIGPKADASITGQLASLGINQLSDLSIEELKKIMVLEKCQLKEFYRHLV